MSKPSFKVSAELEEMVATLLKDAKREATTDKPAMPLEDRLRVIDRALKLEQIKARGSEEDWGAGFDD